MEKDTDCRPSRHIHIRRPTTVIVALTLALAGSEEFHSTLVIAGSGSQGSALHAVVQQQDIGSVVMNALADATVDKVNPIVTFGSENYLFLGRSPEGGQERVILRFDLDDLPDHVEIDSARLELYRNFGFGNGEMRIGIYENNCSRWDEAATSWNKCGNDSSNDTLMMGEGTVEFSGQQQRDYLAIVGIGIEAAGLKRLTDLRSSSPPQPLSITMKWQGEDATTRLERAFCSKEGVNNKSDFCGDRAIRPRLMVRYRLAIPTSTPQPAPTSTPYIGIDLAWQAQPSFETRLYQELNATLVLRSESPPSISDVHVTLSAISHDKAGTYSNVCVGSIETCRRGVNATAAVNGVAVGRTAISPFSTPLVVWFNGSTPLPPPPDTGTSMPTSTATATSTSTPSVTPDLANQTPTPTPSPTVTDTSTPTLTATSSPTGTIPTGPTVSATAIATSTSTAAGTGTATATTTPTSAAPPPSPIGPKEIGFAARIRMPGVEAVALEKTPGPRGEPNLQPAEWRLGKPVRIDVDPYTGYTKVRSGGKDSLVPVPWTNYYQYDADVVYRRIGPDNADTDWTPVPAAVFATQKAPVTRTPPPSPLPLIEGGDSAYRVDQSEELDLFSTRHEYQADICPFEPGTYSYAFRMRFAPDGEIPRPWHYIGLEGEVTSLNRENLPAFVVVDEPTLTPSPPPTFGPSPSPNPTQTPGSSPTPLAPARWLVRGATGDKRVTDVTATSAFDVSRFSHWDNKHLLQAKIIDVTGGRPVGLRSQLVMWQQDGATDWALILEAGWTRTPDLTAFIQRPALRLAAGTYYATYRQSVDNRAWTYLRVRSERGDVVGSSEFRSDVIERLEGKVATVNINRQDSLPLMAAMQWPRLLPRQSSVQQSLQGVAQNSDRIGSGAADEVFGLQSSHAVGEHVLIVVNAEVFQCRTQPTAADCRGDDRITLASRTLGWWLPDTTGLSTLYMPYLAKQSIAGQNAEPAATQTVAPTSR